MFSENSHTELEQKMTELDNIVENPGYALNLLNQGPGL